MHLLRRGNLNIDILHHRRTLRTLDAKRLTILATRREETAINLRVDPILQASLASIDEMLAFARWIEIWESARCALPVAGEAKISD